MRNGASDTERMEPKAKAFICYSQKSDLAVADRTVAALKERGFEGLIDRNDILPTEPWWKRIEELIAQADTVVFVISPEAISSKECKNEVTFVGRLNKRFVPIVWRCVSAKEVPKELGEPNWIFFDNAARFDTSMQELAKALETDIEWIRKHTEFGELARRWDEQKRGRGTTLRGADLEAAERWLDRRPAEANAPTDLHRDFIRASRRAATARQRYWVGARSPLPSWQLLSPVSPRSTAARLKSSASRPRRRATRPRRSVTAPNTRSYWRHALRMASSWAWLKNSTTPSVCRRRRSRIFSIGRAICKTSFWEQANRTQVWAKARRFEVGFGLATRWRAPRSSVRAPAAA